MMSTGTKLLVGMLYACTGVGAYLCGYTKGVTRMSPVVCQPEPGTYLLTHTEIPYDGGAGVSWVEEKPYSNLTTADCNPGNFYCGQMLTPAPRMDFGPGTNDHATLRCSGGLCWYEFPNGATNMVDYLLSIDAGVRDAGQPSPEDAGVNGGEALTITADSASFLTGADLVIQVFDDPGPILWVYANPPDGGCKVEVRGADGGDECVLTRSEHAKCMMSRAVDIMERGP